MHPDGRTSPRLKPRVSYWLKCISASTFPTSKSRYIIITCYRCLDLTCRLFISWDYLYVSTYSPEPTVTQYVNSELAQAVDVMMARAKRIYISIIKVNKSFSSFPSRCFLREIKKHVVHVSIELSKNS